MNFGARPPRYFGYSDPNPSALKLRITSRTRSSLVNATFAIAATPIPCADSSTICARRQVTTRPAAPPHNPHQPPAFIIIDLTHPHAFRHRPSVGDQHPPQKHPAGRTCYGTEVPDVSGRV